MDIIVEGNRDEKSGHRMASVQPGGIFLSDCSAGPSARRFHRHDIQAGPYGCRSVMLMSRLTTLNPVDRGAADGKVPGTPASERAARETMATDRLTVARSSGTGDGQGLDERGIERDDATTRGDTRPDRRNLGEDENSNDGRHSESRKK
jgi:hypothetical protein